MRWIRFRSLIEGERKFQNMLDCEFSGSTPAELFYDMIGDMRDKFEDDKKIVKGMLKVFLLPSGIRIFCACVCFPYLATTFLSYIHFPTRTKTLNYTRKQVFTNLRKKLEKQTCSDVIYNYFMEKYVKAHANPDTHKRHTGSRND
jgi:hypothetical protein